MILFRYMLGDALNGGCVIASNIEEATKKVKAYYEEYATCCYRKEQIIGEDIKVWYDDEAYIGEHPDVLEVY